MACWLTETRTNFTSAPPSEGCSSPLEWNPTSMLFNGSSTGPEPSGGDLTTQVDDILSNIIDEGLDDLNITEMALEDGEQDFSSFWNILSNSPMVQRIWNGQINVKMNVLLKSVCWVKLEIQTEFVFYSRFGLHADAWWCQQWVWNFHGWKLRRFSLTGKDRTHPHQTQTPTPHRPP